MCRFAQFVEMLSKNADSDAASRGITFLYKLTDSPQINDCFTMTAVFKELRPGTDTDHTHIIIARYEIIKLLAINYDSVRSTSCLSSTIQAAQPHAVHKVGSHGSSAI